MGHGGKPWVSDFNDPNYIAGRKAMKTGKISLKKHVHYCKRSTYHIDARMFPIQFMQSGELKEDVCIFFHDSNISISFF